MLKNHVEQEKPQEEELLRRLEDARNHLFALQMQIKERALPVLVLMEGWGAAGKGSTIGKIIRNIDPRFFKVATMSAPTAPTKPPRTTHDHPQLHHPHLSGRE